MFHLRDDIRAERSAKMLYDGLTETLKTKPLNKVSVSDICSASTVSRATFYRNFDEVADLLSWKCEQNFEEMLTGFTTSNPDLSTEDVLIRYILNYWMEGGHMELLSIIMDANRLDIIYNSFVDKAGILMKFLEKEGIHMDTTDYSYFISVRAGFFVGMIRGWMVNGKKQTPDEITAIVRRQHDDVVKSGLLI
ncbi:MAG: TetR/AcrR family transcriptional regulator [Anaerovoracaceae bacterium]|jgi:AcrR family transcriptional regulator